MNLIEKITKHVKKKKELSLIDDSFVEKIVKEKLEKNPKLKKFFEEHEKLNRSKKYKNFIKKIRAHLRKVYGVYLSKGFEKRNEFFKKGDYCSILKTHLSTRERFEIYPKLYKEIWKITGKPKSIIDLACGMNPFSFKFMGLKNVRYLAIDISPEDVKLINKFFKKEGINGKAKLLDLLKIEHYNIFKPFKEFDVAFLFKSLDIPIVKSKKIAELLIKKVPAKWVVVSFATKTIGQRKMKKANREWIKKIAEKLGYKVKVLNFENEVFYVIKKWN